MCMCIGKFSHSWGKWKAVGTISYEYCKVSVLEKTCETCGWIERKGVPLA